MNISTSRMHIPDTSSAYGQNPAQSLRYSLPRNGMPRTITKYQNTGAAKRFVRPAASLMFPSFVPAQVSAGLHTLQTSQ